jgi:signal transduction histidine kinase
MDQQPLTSNAMELTMLPIRRQLPPRAARAHALKNCLAIVSAVNQLVRPELDEAAQLRIARSQSAIRRMAELIEQDLHLHGDAHPNAGEYVSSEQVFDAVRLRVQDLAESRRVQLNLQVGSGGLWGDRMALTEALGNIVKNAVESSRSGGTVIATSNEGVDGGQLWTVRDSGPGIPRHLLSRLGTPFLSRKNGGSGLGIAVARDVFESHGGLLQIESAPGWGTMVTIWVPALPTA